MYGPLPVTGIPVLAYATVGLIMIVVGLIMKRLGK